MAATELPSPNLRQKHVKQLLKTEMCKFFLQNKCGKGSACAFAHSLTEIREKPDLGKTSMCKQFLQTGNCANPRCCYAHDERELRTTSEFFKTKMCRFAASGRCKHGARCRFAHSGEELPPEHVQRARAQQLQQRGASGDGDGTDTSGTSQGGNGQLNGSFEGAPGTRGGGGRQQSSNDWADLNSDQGSGARGDTSSDQSTRAETSASVPTPEGSGDSGQEEFSEAHQRRAGAVDERGRRRPSEPHRPFGRHCTTMMLTNVPNFLTQGALVSLLEDLTVSMRGAFDFFYCPWDPYQDRNLGYCIVNFFSRSVAADFATQWTNQLLLPRTQGCKRLRIVPAALQGRGANLRHFSGFSLAHHTDPRFRPLVRASPNEPLRPMAISEELDARNQDEGSDTTTPYPKEMAQSVPEVPVPAMVPAMPAATRCPPVVPLLPGADGNPATGALEVCRQQAREELLLSMLSQQHLQAVAAATAGGPLLEADVGSPAAAAAMPAGRPRRSAEAQLLQQAALQQGPAAAAESWGAVPQPYLFLPQAPALAGRPGKVDVADQGRPEEMQLPQCWAFLLPQGANAGAAAICSPGAAGLDGMGGGLAAIRSSAGIPPIAAYAANPYLQHLAQLQSQFQSEDGPYTD